MASIPSKQQHRSGSYDSLQAYLSDREIGLCTDDLVLYIKYNGELMPCGYKYEGGTGIEIGDDRKINLKERNSYHAYPDSPQNTRTGPLSIVQGSNSNKSVRIGSDSSDIGLLVPNLSEGSEGAALIVGAGGRLYWGTASVDVESPDDSIKVEYTEGNNRRVVRLSLSDVASAGTYTKVSFNSQGLVLHGENLAPSDIPELDASKIASGTFSPDRIAPHSITGEKIALKTVGQQNLEDGAVGGDQMDLQSLAPVLAENGIRIVEDTGFLVFSKSHVVGNFGDFMSSSLPTNRYVVAGNTDKRVRIDFARISGLEGVTVVLNPEHSDNTWLLDASDISLSCYGVAQTYDDGHSDASKVSHNAMSWSSIGSGVTRSLYFYESGSVPTSYDITMQVLVHVTVGGVVFCAKCDCSFVNFGAHATSLPETFFGCAEFYQLDVVS